MKNKRQIAKEARSILKILWEEVEEEDDYQNVHQFIANLKKKIESSQKDWAPLRPNKELNDKNVCDYILDIIDIF